MSRVLVIGAGIAGLACARTLHDHGVPVTVLDKSRGVGGRTSTRREGPWRFDHGAPQFIANDARLLRYVNAWQHDGVVQAQGSAFLGRDGMNALARHLARDLTVRRGVQVTSLARAGRVWQATDSAGGVHEADVLLLAVPAPQAETLLGESPSLQAAAHAAVMEPCWAVAVGFDRPSRLRIDAAFASGKTTRVVLPQRIPVHMIYATAFEGEGGTIEFRPDVYGRDRKLDAALAGRPSS